MRGKGRPRRGGFGENREGEGGCGIGKLDPEEKRGGD